MGTPFIGGGNGGRRIRGDQEVRHKETEHGHVVYCEATNSVTLWVIHLEARREGVSQLGGTGRHRLGGEKEKGSGGRGSDGFRVRVRLGRRGVEWSEQVEWSGAEWSRVERKGECHSMDDRPELRKRKTKYKPNIKRERV